MNLDEPAPRQITLRNHDMPSLVIRRRPRHGIPHRLARRLQQNARWLPPPIAFNELSCIPQCPMPTALSTLVLTAIAW